MEIKNIALHASLTSEVIAHENNISLEDIEHNSVFLKSVTEVFETHLVIYR